MRALLAVGFAWAGGLGCGPPAPGGGPAAGPVAAPPKPTPPVAPPAASVAQPPALDALVAGGAHTCLARGGALTCWGRDERGQLGDGARVGARPPTRVDGVVDPVRVAAGFEHTCALERSGRLLCWGANFSRQLGADPPDPTRPSPGPELAGLVDVAAGRTHTCALLRTGRVVCWGIEHAGELGRAGGAGPEVAGVVDAVAIAARQGHTCVRAKSGEVLCWGGHWLSGFFGDEQRMPRDRATPIAALAGSDEIAVGAEHVCGRRGGEVTCVSANVDGQLGSASAPCCKPAAAKVPHLDDAVRITAGFRHTCALERSGKVLCWGGAFSERRDARPVAGLTDVVDLAAGDDHVCARRRDGAVWCWGEDGAGQLGAGASARISRAIAVRGIDDAEGLAIGYVHACAKRRGDRVSCWSSSSDDGAPYDVPALAGPGRLRSGVYESCVLAQGGPVRCIGRARNDFGFPAGVLTVPSGARDLVQGGAGICVRTQAGDVACVPEHSDAHRLPGPLPARSARPMPGLAGARWLAVGPSTICAGTRGGTKCVDEIPTLQFPAPDERGWGKVRLMPAIDRGDPAEIVLGSGHGCLRAASGEVRCWGANGAGQLGDGTLEPRRDPVAPVGLADAVELAAGDHHTCARRRDGTVWCWGDDTWGQIGRGSDALDPASAPTRVLGVEGAVEIGAGSASSCARTGDGRVLCWGSNEGGRLGVGRPTRAAQPRQVLGLGAAEPAGSSTPGR